MAELDKRQTGRRSREARPPSRTTTRRMFNSPHQVVLGNPQGNVTMVEFFDYNCGYCKRAMADMLDLMKNDPKLKFVLKEFPVLGEGSVEAAHVAVAVRMQDTDRQEISRLPPEAARRPRPGRQGARARRRQGSRLRHGAHRKGHGERRGQEDHRREHQARRGAGLNGTPSYVVGEEVVVGAVGIDALREKISAERK